MTREEIEQKAEDIVNALTIRPEACIYSRSNMISAVIAGANSRDEEIEQLEERIKVLNMNLVEQQLENQHLRNPWIRVEERLPEEKTSVLCRLTADGSHVVCFYEGKDNKGRPTWNYLNSYYHSGITHWMPIPKL